MLLNYFPLKFDFEQYQIYAENYSVEHLFELRKKYNKTHSFFKNGNKIFSSNKSGDESLTFGTPQNVDVFDQDGITSSLIKHVLFRTFLERYPKYQPTDFYPLRFFSENDKDDLVLNLLPEHLRNLISYKKLIEIQLRFTNILGQKRFGFIISTKRNWKFTKSCDELNNEGYSLNDLEVIHSEVIPGLETILAPNEDFIGVIKELSGGVAKVDTNNGIQEFPLSELFLRKTTFNIKNYLTFAISKEKSEEIFRMVDSKKTQIFNAKNVFTDVQLIANVFFNGKDNDGTKFPILFQNKDGFCFTVDSNALKVSNSISIKTPVFVFDYASTKTQNNFPDVGLNTFGPYDSITFDTKSPTVMSICHSNSRGSFTSFLGALKEGLPNSNWFKKGLLKKYDLQKVEFDIEEINNYNFEEYERVIKNGNDVKPNLALIEIPDNFKQLNDAINPYFRIKAKLLSMEIPVQFVTISKVKKYDEFMLNSLALQIYAKLGGTPWVLPSSRSVDREIIIGIGHSWIRTNKYKNAEQNRVVGITTFFSSDGQYLVGDKVKDVPYDDYFDELLKNLIQSFKLLESIQGWKKGDTIRLIFHIFKPIKNVEFDVVCALIEKYDDYKVQFAFVTISDTHPYLLFDLDQKGFKKFNGELKGQYIPERGQNIVIDSNTCLLQMFGPKELKTSRHGMSSPIQIKIRTPQTNFENGKSNELLFTDLSYIVQQIYSFSYLSWRSFLPSQIPATMLYSTLIAKLLSKLRKVDGWDPDTLNYNLKRKKWFL